jgi:DNA polymerase elongation subunit (family B)
MRIASPVARPPSPVSEEWLWGWDKTPGIVSVWADGDGRATIWRRTLGEGRLVREQARFRPWVLLDRLNDLRHVGRALQPEGNEDASIWFRELPGAGALRFLVSANNARTLKAAILTGAQERLNRRLTNLRDLGLERILALPPEEQYLVATGRNYFRGLAFDDLRRLQFDLETQGLNPSVDRIFMVAVRDPSGNVSVLETKGDSDAHEVALIRELCGVIREVDPDVIENHNLHGFDLPFLNRRAAILGVPLDVGRIGPPGFRQRAASRGVLPDEEGPRRVRLVIPGRELIDTLDAVWRYDFATRELPGHGLKAVARHLGIAAPDRELIRGDQVYPTFLHDPERVRRYASSDVVEVATLARLLGGAAFALARMAPRRYERCADAGAATGIIDPLLVRAYLRSNAALPAHAAGRQEPHSGAALYLFAAGVAERVVKADVASLYPSLMRAFRIGPRRDHLGAMITMVDRLVELRLEAKASARAAPAGSAERHIHEGTSAAMKLVVNSAYGYLAAGGGLTRFADVDAANEVTRRGRETLGLICRELAARGVTLLEADTDGVYFAVPVTWTGSDERRVVGEVASLLPPLVQLEFEGRYRAMLSHEPKNYALLSYDGNLVLKGVAFRSSRAEPFGQAFLRRALMCLLTGDIAGVRETFVATIDALRRREVTTHDVSSRVRLTKSPERYMAIREHRRESMYEAMLARGRRDWRAGDKVRVYRTGTGWALADVDDADVRDYDTEHYVRSLRANYATRMARAFTREDFASLFADPAQPSLFAPDFASLPPILTSLDPMSSTSPSPSPSPSSSK